MIVITNKNLDYIMRYDDPSIFDIKKVGGDFLQEAKRLRALTPSSESQIHNIESANYTLRDMDDNSVALQNVQDGMFLNITFSPGIENEFKALNEAFAQEDEDMVAFTRRRTDSYNSEDGDTDFSSETASSNTLIITRIGAKPLIFQNLDPNMTVAELQQQFIEVPQIKAGLSSSSLSDDQSAVFSSINQRGVITPLKNDQTVGALISSNVHIIATQIKGNPLSEFKGVIPDPHNTFYKAVIASGASITDPSNSSELENKFLRPFCNVLLKPSALEIAESNKQAALKLQKEVWTQIVNIQNRLKRPNFMISTSERKALIAKKSDLEGADDALGAFILIPDPLPANITISPDSKTFLGTGAGGLFGLKLGADASKTEKLLNRVNALFDRIRAKDSGQQSETSASSTSASLASPAD